MSRRRKSPALGTNETYHIIGPPPHSITWPIPKGAAPHALNVAQRMTEQAGEPIVLTVERRTLFGPPAPLYRVVRGEDGTVYTNTINAED